VTIKLRPLIDNEQGLLLVNTNGSIITDSIVSKNLYGFWLGWSSNNIITINNITKNSHGIHFHQSSNNSVYYNNFVNNLQHASTTHDSANSWNHGYPHGGNYWTNHSGIDAYTGIYQNVSGTDGINDTPYIINEKNVDLYPLMKLRIRVPTDLNKDGIVGIDDIVRAGEVFGSNPNTARWMRQADINKDDYIGIDDIVRIALDFGKSWK
jgi:parallel beta-helix repeat protein